VSEPLGQEVEPVTHCGCQKGWRGSQPEEGDKAARWMSRGGSDGWCISTVGRRVGGDEYIDERGGRFRETKAARPARAGA